MVRLNFANGDMVGHTGDMGASVTAMESVDAALKQVGFVCLLDRISIDAKGVMPLSCFCFCFWGAS